MSILTDLAEKKITWHQAEAEVGQWAQNLIAHDPTLTAVVGAVTVDVKQAASDAISMADTALGEFIIPAAKATEVALDTALASATKGASVPFNKFVDDGIDRMAAAVVAEAHTWALKKKAELASPAPVVTAVSPTS